MSAYKREQWARTHRLRRAGLALVYGYALALGLCVSLMLWRGLA